MELIFTTTVLLIVIIVAAIIFYRKIRDATIEYEGSKEVVANITFGFTRQVNRLQQDLNKHDNDISTSKLIATDALKNSSEAKEATLKGLEAVKSLQDRIESTENTVENIKRDLLKISKAPKQRVSIRPDIEAPIPVQHDNILEQLTETELTALRKIADLGEGTVPEIKEHIGLTREHTARMLKRLYETGFVDRTITGMPYRYSVRKELLELILRSPSEVKPSL